ncbi:MAG: FeoB-associated Cys-rich membrane protein [Cellulosilyticum sp.]|nr:FeoB-associated Cys-rich membrane protein [Cellulosilyticum sp.]
MATVIIAGLVFGLMALVIYHKIKAHKNGGSACGCGCSGCTSAKNCHSKSL